MESELIKWKIFTNPATIYSKITEQRELNKEKRRVRTVKLKQLGFLFDSQKKQNKTKQKQNKQHRLGTNDKEPVFPALFFFHSKN